MKIRNIQVLFGLLCLFLSFCLQTAQCEQGFIGGNELYYKGVPESRHRTESDLPLIDFLKFRRAYCDDTDFRLKKVDFIPLWAGGKFNDDHCTRYEIGYLTGRLFRLMATTFGYRFQLRPAGPRKYDITAFDWGSEDVRIGIRSGLFNYHGTKEWWKKPVSNGSFIRFLLGVVQELKKFTPVVRFPLPFPPKNLGASVPARVDPRYPVVQYIYRTGLVSLMPDSKGKWDMRGWASKKEVIEAFDRLIFIISGYKEPKM